MNKDFASALEELLESECGDYEYKYTWSFCADEEVCNVDVDTNDSIRRLKFRYENNQLFINTNDDVFEPIDDLSYEVKYFWIALFNN